ncbi:uncharacterized protein LOC133817533 [Humulus lupulus]|uniref:uncharacterized protein LOC133817533 n=1 Tax=Humulus lupulus TaxID=3486 RepID=UPI002B40F6F5|nr:uncharacterized protein LOC133817533 [Humulus lupulus]
MEIPIDLIKQVQISLRSHASLSSYDPNDNSFPILPSLEEALASLDPSPPYLRCRHCNGRLLRGLQSFICVLCGGEATKEDLPPEPINFRNTLGYQWLLQSLSLDGSETVSSPVETNNSHRGRNAPKDEFPLSELLDLEIKWPSESERFESRFLKETPDQSKSSLNLSGVRLENFFAEEKNGDASDATVESSVSTNQVNTKHSVQGYGNLDLFENAQHFETAVLSNEGESNVSDSGWGANFQSASSAMPNEEAKPIDPFVGSVDLSNHMDEVFGAGKDKKDVETTGSSSMASEWFDDSWNNSKSGLTGPSDEFKTNTNVNTGSLVENVSYSSSKHVDWVQDTRWQSTSNKLPDSKADEGHDSFDDWNDFTSSTVTNNPPNSSLKQTSVPFDDMTSEVNLCSSTNHQPDINLFDSLSQQGVVSAAFSSPTGSTEGSKMLSEASSLDRTSGDNTMVGGNPEDVEKGRNAEIKSGANDVDMLLSQMHDLSFMRDSNLSVPSSQVEGFNSLSQN